MYTHHHRFRQFLFNSKEKKRVSDSAKKSNEKNEVVIMSCTLINTITKPKETTHPRAPPQVHAGALDVRPFEETFYPRDWLAFLLYGPPAGDGCGACFGETCVSGPQLSVKGSDDVHL